MKIKDNANTSFRPNHLGTVLAMILIMAGCSHKIAKPDGEPMLTESKAALSNPELKIVHFALNQSLLSKTAKHILNRDADILKHDSTLKFQIQGFCDDRGTVAYNLVLGKKRAIAVRVYLESLGISADRISILSFG